MPCQSGLALGFRSEVAVTVGGKVVAAAAMLYRTTVALLKEWQRRNADLQELARLNDRDLRDMGLTRYDIPYLPAFMRAQEVEFPDLGESPMRGVSPKVFSIRRR